MVLALYICCHSEGAALVKEHLNVRALVAHGFKIAFAENGCYSSKRRHTD